MKHYRKQNGYALLIVLIAIAIVLILCATQMKTLFVPTNLPKQKTGIEQRPWLLEELLIPAGEKVKLPRPPKPQLDEAFTLNGSVSRDEEQRGTAVVDFATDGRIHAVWETAYSLNEQTHTITAEMDGNIDVKRTFEGPEGRDKSRLFFIAQGPYLMKTTGADVSRPDEEGTAWLIGWLKPDRTADGYITLTTDRKWSAVYEWTVEAGEK